MESTIKGRVCVTVLNAMAELFWGQDTRKDHFRPIAMKPIGWGAPGSTNTEVGHYQSVAFFVEVAREEKSSVFILGYGPRSIPAIWVKLAELIVQGSGVTTVLIPHCTITNEDRNNPIVRGSIFWVNVTGIFKIQVIGEVPVKEFWNQVADTAHALNQETVQLPV